ncbi:MAG: YbaB/EbfC family nucleoid-associated protein [Bacteroidia bacterium]|nr:YbaB/EbfC family nucleoid-associated protein [Bacteroidia bacterium]
MNMQNLLAQAQKMQRELKKAHEDLAQEEFSVSKGGAVTVVFYGDRKIKSVSINQDALSADNKDMIEEMLEIAIDEVLNNIKAAEDDINMRITGRAEGMMGL